MDDPAHPLTCQQCRELAAELALNVLSGRERVGALAHLDRCASCRDMVCALTATADRLVELLPDADPPAGFEKRATTAVRAAARRGSRTTPPRD
jgi:hypothetical protein